MHQKLQRYAQYLCSMLVTALVISGFPLSANNLSKEYADDPDRVLRTSLSNGITTLDPAIAYDWSNYNISMAIGCRLLKISNPSPNTEEALQPQLATSYTTSADQRSYTFTLSEDWYFHNGRRVEAKDVKYSLERVLSKKIGSPGASFLSGVVGEKDFNEDKADHITGIEVLGPHQLRVTLHRPRVSFLFGLGTNFGSIIDHEEADKKEFGKFPVSCGAFKVESFGRDQLVLTASPYYNKKDSLYWKKIVYTLREDHKKASLRLLRGQVDLIQTFFTTVSEINPSRNPELAKYLFNVKSREVMSTVFLSLNRRQPQLRDVKVRKAINMAIDKQGIVNLFVKEATVATQVLPPHMPGYDVAQKGYAYDPVAARALLKEAGFEQGFSIELLVLDQNWMRSVARTIQNDLMEIGIKVKIRSEPLSKYLEIAGDPEKAGIVYSEGVAWSADYPDPSNFYWPLFSKESIDKGWNWAYYENENTDKLARQADAFVTPKNQEQRLEGWRSVYRELHKEAAWVPLYNNALYVLKSPQIKFPSEIENNANPEDGSDEYYIFSYREKAK